MYSLHTKLFKLQRNYGELKIINFGGETSLPINSKRKTQSTVSDELKKLLVNKNMDIHFTYFNASTFNFNSPKDIENILKHNVTMEDIKKIQYEELKNLEYKNFSKILPYIQINENDRSDSVRDIIWKNNETIVTYSIAVTEFMKQLNFELNNTKKVDYTKLELRLLEIIKQMSQNFELIYSINNTTDILLIGMYMPKFLERLSYVLPGAKELQTVITEYIEELKIMCKRYDVKYVDIKEVGQKTISNDIYLNRKGNEIIARKTIEGLFDSKFHYTGVKNPVGHRSTGSKIITDESRLSGLYDEAIINANQEQIKVLEKIYRRY